MTFGFIQIFLAATVFFSGWFAGGPFEGNDCYTVIHYADEAEAAACNVAEGTPLMPSATSTREPIRYSLLMMLGQAAITVLPQTVYAFGPGYPR